MSMSRVRQEMDWTSPEIVSWGKEHFDKVPINGVWAPEGLGFVFMRVSNDTYELTRCVQHPESMRALAGVRSLLWDLGYKINDGNVVWDEAPRTQEEVDRISQEHLNEVISSWRCGCGFPLREMDNERVSAVMLSEEETLLDNGDTHMIEVWAYPVKCQCGEVINVDPMDFRTIVGDERYHRHTVKGIEYQALTRDQIITALESDYDAQDYTPVGKMIDGEKVPPWLWGLFCKKVIVPDEEE